MKRIPTISAAALAGAAMLASSPASAQLEDMDPAAVAAATRYALPHAYEGFMNRCFDTLSPDGFAVSNADRLRAKFSEGADAAWPGAKSLIINMTSREAGDMSEMVEMLGDDALRPFVDGLVQNMVAQEVPLEECETIERGLEIFDPLPADNMAAMVGFLLEITADDEEEGSESRQRKLREQEESTRR